VNGNRGAGDAGVLSKKDLPVQVGASCGGEIYRHIDAQRIRIAGHRPRKAFENSLPAGGDPIHDQVWLTSSSITTQDIGQINARFILSIMDIGVIVVKSSCPNIQIATTRESYEKNYLAGNWTCDNHCHFCGWLRHLRQPG
jgi:hypothetical protein